MKTAKITKINWTTEWKWEHGTVYYFKLELDNWEHIELGKKSNDAFKLWDEVKYEDYIDAKGYTKQKEVKENPFKKTYNPEANNRGAMVGLAIKTAFENAYTCDEDFDKAAKLAKRIFDVAMEIYNWTDTPKEEDKTVDKEDDKQSSEKPWFNQENLDKFVTIAKQYKNADEALKEIKQYYRISKDNEGKVRRLYEDLELINS